jgi:hypothetical protein
MEPCRGSDPGPNPGPGAFTYFSSFFHKTANTIVVVHTQKAFFAAAAVTFSITKSIVYKIIVFLIFHYA